jgi:hypothetical protein
MKGAVVAAVETRSGILDTGLGWVFRGCLTGSSRTTRTRFFGYCDAMQILKGAEHSDFHCTSLSVGLWSWEGRRVWGVSLLHG